MYVRADRFLIARTMIACPRCSRPTEVIGLVLPPGHETDESDGSYDSVENESGHKAQWMKASQTAFVFLVEQVSPGVERWLRTTAKQYAGESAGPGPSVLRNHCIICGCAIDDQELYSEPGHAYLPASALEAGKVSLALVDQPIEATVDGYAYEPEFFEFMNRV